MAVASVAMATYSVPDKDQVLSLIVTKAVTIVLQAILIIARHHNLRTFE